THCTLHFPSISCLIYDLIKLIHIARRLHRAIIVHKSIRIPIDATVRRGVVEKLLKLVFDKRSPSALQQDLQQIFARLGGVSAGREVVQALPRYLTDAERNVRQAAVRTFGQLGASVATPDVVQALLRCLTDAERNVRQAVVETLRKLAGFIRLKEWPEAPALFVPLARSRNEEKREVGYVCLRNLLMGEREGVAP
ncbi:MAG: HEAT repeat domain-containing protein, partial [Candidatus Binatia bacterium]